MFGLMEVVDDPSGSVEMIERRRGLRRQRGERRRGRKRCLEEASLEECHGIHVVSWR